MYTVKISMGITNRVEDRASVIDPPIYFVQREDIEHLRLELHKDVDNLINAHKSNMRGTKEPRIKIIKEGFSGTNGKA